MIDWEAFQTAYQNSDASTKQVVDSGSIPTSVTTLLPNITSAERRVVINSISAHIMGVYPLPDVLDYLTKSSVAVTEEQLSQIVSEAKETASQASNQNIVSQVETTDGESTFSSNQDSILGQTEPPPQG